MKNKLIALIMPVFFIAFSVWVYLSGRAMGENLGKFPRLIAVFTFCVAIFHLVDVLRRKDHENNFQHSNLRKVLELLAVLAIYVVLFKRLGYIICTSLLMFYVIVAQGYKKYAIAASVSVGFTLVVYFIFKILLKVPLPTLFL